MLSGEWCAVEGLLVMLLLGPALSSQQFVRQPSDQHVRLGQNIVLPCQVANAVGRVQWTRDEFGLGVIRDLPSYPRYQMIGDDSEGIYSLQIQRVDLVDDAVFQCQVGAAVGQPGIRSHDARVTVLVPPHHPVISQGESLSAMEGATIRVECLSLAGKPPAEILWYLEDREMDSSHIANTVTPHANGSERLSDLKSTLILRVTADMDGSIVQCRAHNSALSAPQTTQLRLIVRYVPHVRVRIRPAVVNEGDSAVAICRTHAKPSEHSLRWYVNGRLFAANNEKRIVLTNLTKDDHQSIVTCHVTNEIGQSNSSLEIAVRHAPWFISPPMNVSANIGDSATISCNVSGFPVPVVSWYRADCSHPASLATTTAPLCRTPIGNGSSIQLTANRHSTGHYFCFAKSPGFPPIKRRISLLLRSRPKVTSAKIQLATPGSDTTIKCRASSLPAVTRFLWMFNGKTLKIDGSNRHYSVKETLYDGGIMSELHIKKVSSAKLGIYSCVFTNEFGTDTASIVLRQNTGAFVWTVGLATFSVLTLFTLCVVLVFVCIGFHRSIHLKSHNKTEVFQSSATPNRYQNSPQIADLHKCDSQQVTSQSTHLRSVNNYCPLAEETLYLHDEEQNIYHSDRLLGTADGFKSGYMVTEPSVGSPLLPSLTERRMCGSPLQRRPELQPQLEPNNCGGCDNSSDGYMSVTSKTHYQIPTRRSYQIPTRRSYQIPTRRSYHIPSWLRGEEDQAVVL